MWGILRRDRLRPLVAVLVAGTGCAATPPTQAPTVEVAAPVPQPVASTEGPPPPSTDVPPINPPPVLEPPEHPVAPTADFGRCMRSRMCQYEGLCSPSDSGMCIAESDDDCKPSDACLGGRCTMKNGVCVAASDEDCRGSWACKGYGMCTHDGKEACMATSPADCRASTRCQRDGECNLRNGVCVAAP
jgi:hypothetical protein